MGPNRCVQELTGQKCLDLYLMTWLLGAWGTSELWILLRMCRYWDSIF